MPPTTDTHFKMQLLKPGDKSFVINTLTEKMG